jgi:hypothetical protein
MKDTQIENPEINPYLFSQLIFNNCKEHTVKYSTNGAEKLDMHVQKMKLDLFLSP